MLFVPYDNFEECAKSFDNKRLGYMRRVAREILDILGDPNPNKRDNHPAVLMWKGHEEVLAYYHDILIDEWISRGFNNTFRYRSMGKVPKEKKYPWWFGKNEIHRSHRSVLINKDVDYYGEIYPKKDRGYNKGLYWYPVNATKTFKTITTAKKTK